tara:strand:- start:18392 stop:19057 length:666 start_codon:yes stop_codon:yes gene_type:complete
MHETISNLIQIEAEIKEKIKNLKYTNYKPVIIAVSKTFNIDHISHLIDFGHTHYGENKVQEALEKWSDIKKENSSIKLHMIGKLQTNKVKSAVKIFDYIHSVDSIKLAKKIASENLEQKKITKVFIQVNLAEESQKSGVSIKDLSKLVEECKNFKLNVMGLMCLPPFSENSDKYFSKLKILNDKLNFNNLSMGMSDDYISAIKFKSNFLRIGSKIFGSRNY